MTSIKEQTRLTRWLSKPKNRVWLIILVCVTINVGDKQGGGPDDILVAILVVLSCIAYVLLGWWKRRFIKRWSRRLGSHALNINGAKLIEHGDNPMLYNVVSEIALAAGLPTPRIIVLNDPALIAFADGRNPERSIIAFTTGMLESMNREELQGIVGHELAHIARKDEVWMATASVTSYLGISREKEGGGLVQRIIHSRILAALAKPRHRDTQWQLDEIAADAVAITYTVNPSGLRNALLKLQAESGERNKLLSMCPATQARIDALEEML